MSAVLEVRDLRKAYAGVRALDGVSFSVAAGSITGNLVMGSGLVDYTGYTTAVTFNLNGTVTGGSTGIGGTWSGITTVKGSASNSGADTIAGVSQTYNLTALNAGNNGTVTWTLMDDIADSGTGTIEVLVTLQ